MPLLAALLVAEPLPAAADSTSALVIRPAGPLPETCARFTPSAAAARAATGEILAPSGACTGGSGRERRAPEEAAGADACVAAPAPVLRRAITCPTVTVSPSSTSSSVTVPVAGEGSSMSTLSVEISTIGGVQLDRVADLHMPFQDRALADGLAGGGSDDVHDLLVFRSG